MSRGLALLWASACVAPATTVTTSDTAPSGDVRFAGGWLTSLGETMNVSVNGSEAQGWYSSRAEGGYHGTFTGTVSGSTLSGRWSQDGDHFYGAGTMQLTLSPDGNTFSGSFQRESGRGPAAGAWSGTRLLVVNTQLSFAGRWMTSVGQTLEIEMNGNFARGRFASNDASGFEGRLEGRAEGYALSGRWSQRGPPLDGAGAFQFVLAPDGKSFTGHYWREAGPGAPQGEWNGTRL